MIDGRRQGYIDLTIEDHPLLLALPACELGGDVARKGGEDLDHPLVFHLAHDDGVRVPSGQEKPGEAKAAEGLPGEDEGISDGFFLVERPRDAKLPLAADGVGQFLEPALFSLHEPDSQIALPLGQRDAHLLLDLVAVQDRVAHFAVQHSLQVRLGTCAETRGEQHENTDDALHPKTPED